MMCSDQPGRQSVQKHQLVLLVAEVLVEGGEDTCCVCVSGEEGDDATWIGDTERGGEDGAVFWRFGWVLVLLGPFLLLAWLGWGHRHPMFEHSWPLPICQSAATKNKIS